MAKAELKSLKVLIDRYVNGDKKTFYIPTYQRGYRWTKEQVEELLGDLYDFAGNHSGRKDDIYCLQPIIIKPADSKGSKWELIDGQQRLTTLALLYAVYEVLNSGTGTVICNSAYNMLYEGKESFSKLFREITSYRGTGSGFTALLNTSPATIDCDFLLQSLNTILNFEIRGAKIQTVLNTIFDKDDYINVIWYELDKEDSIKTFSNINANKIGLTDAELIKALLLNAMGNGAEDCEQNVKIQKMSLQWEELEKGLNQENLWCFMNDKRRNEYDTRIDYLFEIWCAISGKTPNKEDDHPLFNQIEKVFKSVPNAEREEKAAEIWDKILYIYETMVDWYNDFEYYHLIGLYIIIAQGEDAENVKGLFSDFESSVKSAFIKTLRRKIRDELFVLKSQLKAARANGMNPKCVVLSDDEYSKPANGFYAQAELECPRSNTTDPVKMAEEEATICNLANRMMVKAAISELCYKHDNDKIRAILLLYNIAMLVNEKKGYEIFPFNRFKIDNWDIEHINPQNPLDAKEEEIKEWLESYRSLLAGLTKDQIQMLNQAQSRKNSLLDCAGIQKRIDNSIKNSEFNTIAQIGRDISDYLGIGETDRLENLALLDQFTNTHYHNDCFFDKRKEIVRVERGELSSKRNTEASGKAYIPLGTRWVFLKAYDGTKSLIVWGADDKKAYMEDMAKTIIQMLGNMV